MNEIFLPGNVPSLKNSKVKTSKGIFHSKTVRRYLSFLGIKKYSARDQEVVDMKTRPNLFRQYVSPLKEITDKKEYPYWFFLHFVRDSKRKFDFINAAQILFDLMQAHKIIDEDNIDHVLPCPFPVKGSFYSIDKEKPGVYIQCKKELNNMGMCEICRKYYYIQTCTVCGIKYCAFCKCCQ